MVAYVLEGVEVWANDATGTVTSGGTDAPAAGTSESWVIDVSIAFPAASTTSDPPTGFYICDTTTGPETEKVLVETCTGGTGSLTCTVIRGADGTTPVKHTAGFTVKTVITHATLKAIQNPAWNAASQFGADSTGSTDCYSAVSSMLTSAAAATGPVPIYFPAGVYSHSEGWTIPPNVSVYGDFISGNATIGSLTGTVFEPRASYTGDYVFYVPDVGHVITNGPIIRHIGINGVNQTASPVDAIQFYGPTLSAVVDDVRMIYMSGWAMNFLEDTIAGETTEAFPFGLEVSNVFVDTCGQGGSAGGINAYWCEDSTFRNVYVIGCDGPGIVVTANDNTKWSDSRAEWNGTYGWHITGDWSYASTGACQFTNCSTDRNTYDGVYIDAEWTGADGDGTGPSPLMFTNLACHRDGEAGGTTYAGVRINGSGNGEGYSTLPMVIWGLTTAVGDNDGGGGTMSPYYGLYYEDTGTTPIVVYGGVIWGATDPTGTAGTVSGVELHAYFPAHGNQDDPTFETFVT